MIGAPQLARPRRNRGWLPGGVPRIDWTNPLAFGLNTFYLPGSTGGIDLSGFGSTASFTGSPTVALDTIGQVISFNGTQYLATGSLTNAGNTPGNSQLTIIIYVKRGIINTQNALIERSVGSSPGDYFVYFNSSNNLAADVPFVAGGVITSVGAIADTTVWHKIALTRSGSPGSWAYQTFIDGKFDTSSTSSANPVIAGNQISLNTPTNGGFVGTQKIASVAIYNRVLTANQILDDYLEGFPFLIFPEDRLAAQLVGRASGAGVSVAYPLGLEFLLSQRAARGMAIEAQGRQLTTARIGAEFGAGLRSAIALPGESLVLARSTPSAPVETLASLRRIAVAPAESASTFRAAIVAPTELAASQRANMALSGEFIAGHRVALPIGGEFLAGQRRLAPAPAEWTGAVSVVAISGIPVEWLSGQERGAALQIEALARLTGNAPLRVEALGGVSAGFRATIEVLARVGRSGAAPIEWLSSAITVVSSASLPIEALGRLSRGAPIPLESSASTNAVVMTGRMPIEWLGRTGQALPLLVESTSTITVLITASALPLEFRTPPPAPFLATLLATASARLRIATAAPRLRIVTFLPKVGMSQARDLFPAQDAVVEGERVGFDFGPALGPGVSIAAVTSVTCAVYSGADFTPAARVLGLPQIVASAATGAAAAQVNQLFGGMLPAVTYRLQCVAQASDGQSLSLWAHLPSRAPN